jgi:hypothetical protein
MRLIELAGVRLYGVLDVGAAWGPRHEEWQRAKRSAARHALSEIEHAIWHACCGQAGTERAADGPGGANEAGRAAAKSAHKAFADVFRSPRFGHAAFGNIAGLRHDLAVRAP